jgi:succinyl-CoA synthetase beta subunit
MASTEGGVEIEQVAEETPELIHKAEIDPLVGPQAYQARELGFKLGLNPTQMKQFVKIFMGLANMFNDFDFALLEINPLVITDEGNLHCLDGKIGVDGNALYLLMLVLIAPLARLLIELVQSRHLLVQHLHHQVMQLLVRQVPLHLLLVKFQ